LTYLCLDFAYKLMKDTNKYSLHNGNYIKKSIGVKNTPKLIHYRLTESVKFK